MATAHQEFWQKYAGLVWSNQEVDDAVRIRAALLRPRFERLLSIALEFGLERLRQEWTELLGDPTVPTGRARDSVERILSNIEKGFARASCRN